MEVWEAGITLGFLPCLCIATYVAEKNILGKICGFKKEVKIKVFELLRCSFIDFQ